MNRTRSKAPRSLDPDPGSLRRATQKTSPNCTTKPSRSPSSGIVKTDGSSSLRVKSEVKSDEKELHYDKITIDEIKKELREFGVPVPSRRNKPSLFKLLEEMMSQRSEETKYRTKKMSELKERTRRPSDTRDMEKRWTELKALIAEHGVALKPKPIEALEKEYMVPREIKDERNIPLKVDEASQPDGVRCGRTSQPKAIKALPGHTKSARSGSINTQQASAPRKHLFFDDGNSPLSTRDELLVDSARNTSYDIMLECVQPGDNVNKFFRLQIFVNENRKFYSVVIRSGRNGKDGRKRLYTYDSAEPCVDRFETIFKEKTGRDWKTKDKRTKGRGYEDTTIIETRDQTYKSNGTGEIPFGGPSESKTGNFSDDNPFQEKMPPK